MSIVRVILLIFCLSIVSAFTDIAFLLSKCTTYIHGGVLVNKDCNQIMRLTGDDRNQDFEFKQGGWKLVIWNDDGKWENATLTKEDGSYREGITLNKSPSTTVDLRGYTDFGSGCSDGSIKEFCEASLDASFQWLTTEMSKACWAIAEPY